MSLTKRYVRDGKSRIIGSIRCRTIVFSSLSGSELGRCLTTTRTFLVLVRYLTALPTQKSVHALKFAKS
jgi:hypothetical protein